jgi:hypothetical protein
VRSVNRRVLDAVDAVGPTTLVLDAAAVVGLPVTVLDRFADLQRELEARNVVLWVAALAPRALATAQQLPQWSEAVDEGRIFPTSLAAVRAYVGRPREGASRGRQ